MGELKRISICERTSQKLGILPQIEKGEEVTLKDLTDIEIAMEDASWHTNSVLTEEQKSVSGPLTEVGIEFIPTTYNIY